MAYRLQTAILAALGVVWMAENSWAAEVKVTKITST